MTGKNKIPKVRVATPNGRPIQLRYTDPTTGKEVRITTGTHNEAEAIDQMAKLEAKLLLGIDAKPRQRNAGGPGMNWEDFRDRYRTLQLHGLRENTQMAAESRLDIAEKILKPRKLSDLANSEALHDLQSRLLAGEHSKLDHRAAYTVRNYLAAIVAALNWACYMGWLPAVPRVKKIKVAKLRQGKGRGLTEYEFSGMLAAVEGVVGPEASKSWDYTLRGLWESGLRLDELMHLHWSDGRYIVPQWKRGRLPVLAIPAPMQKNDTEEIIPLLPGLESLLLETPEPQRFGWVFNPMSLQTKLGRSVRHRRSKAEWVGKIVSRCGEAAGVIVRAAVGARAAKYASAHDLRRSCAERLVSAGIPEREVSRVLRHANVDTTRRFYAPGTVQESAGIIRELLSVPRYNELVEST